MKRGAMVSTQVIGMPKLLANNRIYAGVETMNNKIIW